MRIVDSLMNEKESTHKRQWRDYQTEGGARPVKDFIMALPDEDRASVLEEMRYVREHGVMGARHVRGEIYEVRASHNTNIYRILFAREGRFKHILLSLEGFQKKTQETPLHEIELAERRLVDWRRQGSVKKDN